MADQASPPHLSPTCWRACTRPARALAVEGGLPPGIDLSRVVVEPPRDASHGDMATNAAMVLAKEAGQSRANWPKRSRPGCAPIALIAAVEVAGPGFINLT